MIESGVYEHFKGGRYEVMGVATHTETGEELVVYRAMVGDVEWKVRPLSMFTEEVLVDGRLVSRFRRVE
jgi:hypothetical protein